MFSMHMTPFLKLNLFMCLKQGIKYFIFFQTFVKFSIPYRIFENYLRLNSNIHFMNIDQGMEI